MSPSGAGRLRCVDQQLDGMVVVAGPFVCCVMTMSCYVLLYFDTHVFWYYDHEMYFETFDMVV